MRSIRKIETLEEFLKYYRINHKYYYFGNKKITEDKALELEKKDDIRSFKENAIYVFEDGYYFIINTKPVIDSTLYYDDETPEPEKTLEYFINYNISNFKFDFSDWKKEVDNLKNNGICSGRVELKPFINKNYNRDSKEVYLVFWEYFGKSRRDDSTIRNLTEEEIADILEISKEEKQKYIERLTKYFYKYNNKIHSHGYWANR